MSINECRAIYSEAFGTDEDFENRLFSACADYCKTLCINGKPFQCCLPCNIYNGGGIIPAYYIFAAATKKKFRGNGYMTQLINSLETDRLLFLKPADAPLFKFYGNLGFKRFEISADENRPIYAEPIGGFARLALSEKPISTDCTALYKYEKTADIGGLYFPHLME